MILAKGKIAKKPYELSYLGQNIYSIEELCYVIYHNIYGINEEFFQISLAKWMKEELGLKELAEKFKGVYKEGCELFCKRLECALAVAIIRDMKENNHEDANC